MALLDPSQDILAIGQHPLDTLFKPRSVAVVGATERYGSVGRTLLKNLVSSPFGGAVYPVNPKKAQVLGVSTFPSIAACPTQVDVVIVILPAKAVPALVQECVDCKVSHAIIISAGFREVGPEGEALEEEVKAIAAKGKLRIVGPNCLGLMCPTSGFNATFANLMPKPGSVAFVSQSGAMITSVLDWSVGQKVGFSAVISVGAMMDVDFSDFIEYLANDENTKSIVLYMETIGNARQFLSAAREASLSKPIVVIKGGKTDAAAQAAASHTGSLTGSDAVLDAAFKRAGVLRVEDIADVFEMADVLSKQPLANGRRMAILTNAGGPGVLACDALVKNGGVLAELEPSTIEKLNKVLPAAWSHGNPIDILGDATARTYENSLAILAEDKNCDGYLVVLTPQAMTAPTDCATALKKYATSTGKPVLSSWMGGPDVEAGAQALREAGIPCYKYPDMACRTFNYMNEYRSNLESNYERIDMHSRLDELHGAREEASKLINGIRKTGRTLMTEAESKKLLKLYGLPVTACEVAQSPKEAGEAAEKIGFPVVVKLNSTTITHKFDVGGVKLNLRSKSEVEKAFTEMKESVSRLASPEGFEGVTVQPMISMKGHEIILGSSLDPQLGPVVLFGMGGSLVEVFKDSALGLPPLNANLATKMLHQTKIYEALKGVRGMKGVDTDKLKEVMVRFSVMVVDHPEIMECDINPLIASPDGILSLDSRVLLHPPEMKALPQPAIRPYPYQYVKSHEFAGSKITIRPILHEDEESMKTFYSQASWPTGCNTTSLVHEGGSKPTVDRDHLIRTCFTDFDRSIVLVVESMEGGKKTIWGVGRVSKEHMSKDMIIALQVLPKYAKKGLGRLLAQSLLQAATAEGAAKVKALLNVGNTSALTFVKSLGFVLNRTSDENIVQVSIPIKAQAKL
mmetsp:Transcript_69491/g.145133  ORF Transcript_69491/g.145133 Transcript_69491/m.145133 type:complete len:913 (-) Transcript_69491:501-3239(-)